MIPMNWNKAMSNNIENVTFPETFDTQCPFKNPRLFLEIVRRVSILPVEFQIKVFFHVCHKIKVEYHVLPLCSKKLLAQYTTWSFDKI